MSRPVLIIGLDGASDDVLAPLIAAGDMPTLGRLRERGASGMLRSVVPPITPAAWSSFMTGKRPGKHGIYDFRLYDPQGYRDTFVTSRALKEPTLWELLTAAGRRVAVVNLPVTYPPNPRLGTVVSGFDTPSVASGFTHPPELRERILARIPDYFLIAVPDPSDPELQRAETFGRFADDVERAFEQRARVALDLLGEGPWDAFMVHFQDTDILQHRAWRFIAERERFPERWARLRGVYRRLDGLLAELLAATPPDSLLVVLSDHGFGPHAGRLYPNVLLRQWGYLSWRGRRRERLRRSLHKRLVRLGVARARAKRRDPWIAQVRDRSFERMLPLRWKRTRAYVALAEMYGLLYVNLRGREPEGIVTPGPEQAHLIAELQERFREVRDPRDGAPVFADVVRGEDVYPTDALGRRPDLVLVPRGEYSVYRDLNHQLWLAHYPVTSGTHRPEGVLMVSGTGVRPGPLARPAELIDLAPTILATAGLPVPEDMDGRVLTEVFTDPPAIRLAPALERKAVAPDELSAAEEGQVLERLRALGYME
jgi:predicted AlkP superfamily phosphohydrolase/phosphomutase